MPVTRQSNKGKRLANDEESPDDSYTSDEVEDAPPVRKRVKTKAVAKESGGKVVKRRKASKLSKLPDMPLDVLFEVLLYPFTIFCSNNLLYHQIFSCLHPLDLLHLARTTKSLRAVVMNRSARSVWRDAFASVDALPDCPEDISEPEYANLVFDNLCHVRQMTVLKYTHSSRFDSHASSLALLKCFGCGVSDFARSV